jgi:hypothetical protein
MLDLKSWLIEMGTPADKVDAILPALPADAATKIEAWQTAAVTARQAELDAAQKKLDDANERLNLEMLEWAETQRTGGQVTDKMRADYAKAQGEVARLTTIVTSKATELGLDPKTILGEVPPATPPAPPAPNLDGYVKVDEFNQRLGQYGGYLMDLPAELEDLAQDYFELTGQRLSRKDIVAEIRTRAADKLNRNADGSYKKPIDARAIYEEKYNIPALRAAKSKETHDAEIAAAEARGEERARTQAALPGQSPAGRHAPVFRTGEGDHKPALPRPSQVASQDRLSKAVSSLATHKYRKSA